MTEKDKNPNNRDIELISKNARGKRKEKVLKRRN